MDVITISSDEEEESDPLQLDNLPSRVEEQIPYQDANNSRPTVLQKAPILEPDIVIVDIPQEQEASNSRPRPRKKINLTTIPTDTYPIINAIKIEKPTNGVDITQQHKVKTKTRSSQNIVDNVANMGEVTTSGHNMEDSESDVLFRKFTDACKEVGEPGEEMDRIVNRVSHYYDVLNVGYKTSKQFKRLLDKNIERVTSDPANMYSYVLEVCTEMKSRKTTSSGSSAEPETKRARISNGRSEGASTSDSRPSTSRASELLTSYGSQDTTISLNSQENDEYDSDSAGDRENEEDVKKRRQVKKLNRQLVLCSKHIEKLEKAEVDWDDDGDSTYISLQTWRERAVKIYKKICEYTGERDKSSYRIHLTNLDSTSRFPEVDRCIRKFVNKTGEFPDFQDILKIYNEYNEKEQHNLTPIQVHGYAADMFQMIGNELQRKRKLDNWDLHCEYLKDLPDPADDDSGLTNRLQDNQKLFITKINQLMDEFAQKQTEQKLEPVEVTEEEANKSEAENSDAEEEEADRIPLLEEDSAEKQYESETDNAVNAATIDVKKVDNTSDTETPDFNSISTALGLTRVELPPTVESATSPTQTTFENLVVATDNCEENTSASAATIELENRSPNQDTSLAAVVTTSSSDVSTRPASKGDIVKSLVAETDINKLAIVEINIDNCDDDSIPNVALNQEVGAKSPLEVNNVTNCVSAEASRKNSDSAVSSALLIKGVDKAQFLQKPCTLTAPVEINGSSVLSTKTNVGDDPLLEKPDIKMVKSLKAMSAAGQTLESLLVPDVASGSKCISDQSFANKAQLGSAREKFVQLWPSGVRETTVSTVIETEAVLSSEVIPSEQFTTVEMVDLSKDGKDIPHPTSAVKRDACVAPLQHTIDVSALSAVVINNPDTAGSVPKSAPLSEGTPVEIKVDSVRSLIPSSAPFKETDVVLLAEALENPVEIKVHSLSPIPSSAPVKETDVVCLAEVVHNPTEIKFDSVSPIPSSAPIKETEVVSLAEAVENPVEIKVDSVRNSIPSSAPIIETELVSLTEAVDNPLEVKVDTVKSCIPSSASVKETEAISLAEAVDNHLEIKVDPVRSPIPSSAPVKKIEVVSLAEAVDNPVKVKDVVSPIPSPSVKETEVVSLAEVVDNSVEVRDLVSPISSASVKQTDFVPLAEIVENSVEVRDLVSPSPSSALSKEIEVVLLADALDDPVEMKDKVSPIPSASVKDTVVVSLAKVVENAVEVQNLVRAIPSSAPIKEIEVVSLAEALDDPVEMKDKVNLIPSASVKETDYVPLAEVTENAVEVRDLVSRIPSSTPVKEIEVISLAEATDDPIEIKNVASPIPSASIKEIEVVSLAETSDDCIKINLLDDSLDFSTENIANKDNPSPSSISDNDADIDTLPETMDGSEFVCVEIDNNNSNSSVSSLVAKEVDLLSSTEEMDVSNFLAVELDNRSPQHITEDGIGINNFVSVECANDNSKETVSLPNVANVERDPLEKSADIGKFVVVEVGSDDSDSPCPSPDIMNDIEMVTMLEDNRVVGEMIGSDSEQDPIAVVKDGSPKKPKRKKKSIFSRVVKRKRASMSSSLEEEIDISKFLAVEVVAEESDVIPPQHSSKETFKKGGRYKSNSVEANSKVAEKATSVSNIDEDRDDFDISKFVTVEIDAPSPTPSIVELDDEQVAVETLVDTAAHGRQSNQDNDPDIFIEEVPAKHVVAVKMSPSLNNKSVSFSRHVKREKDIDISKFLTVEVNADTSPLLVACPQITPRLNNNVKRNESYCVSSKITTYEYDRKISRCSTKRSVDRGALSTKLDVGKFVAVKIGLSVGDDKKYVSRTPQQSRTPLMNRMQHLPKSVKTIQAGHSFNHVPSNYGTNSMVNNKNSLLPSKHSTSIVNSSLLKLSNQGSITVECLQPSIQVRSFGKTRHYKNVTNTETAIDEDIIVLD